MQLAIADGVASLERAIFDYGAGRGGDIKRLAKAGYKISGWDPEHLTENPLSEADVVNFGYVLNVIERPRERIDALRSAWGLARKALVVAARPDWEAGTVRGRPHADGIITSKGTFQKFFAQDELRDLIAAVCETEPVAAAPGIFYVFRDHAEAAGIKARRFRSRRPGVARPRQADVLWDAHRELLEPLALFWEERGRLPETWELSQAPAVESEIGSLRRAAGILRRVLGDERFADASRRAADDLTVFLALEAFRGRAKFSHLPADVQLDVRSLFGSYKQACAVADELLFSMADDTKMDSNLRSVPFGKVLPDAVYVHADCVSELPPLVRVYEGSGRALLGDVEGATIVKLSRKERRISYLAYPRFEQDPHPELATSLRADLRTFRVKWRDFRESSNPPVLHRKETFVSQDHPSQEKFARLTRQEERAGLFEDPTRIGTRDGWSEALRAAGKRLRGHRLAPASDEPNASGDG